MGLRHRSAIRLCDDVAMGEVIVVTGPPGAGKSTVAALLVEQLTPSALVAGDDFFAFLRQGAIEPWLDAAHAQNTAVIRAAAAATGRLADWCDVVYDGVVGPWFLDNFLDLLAVEAFHYAVLLPSLGTCLDRVRTRVGHGFTDQGAAEHMWRQFTDAALDRRHVVSDDGSSPQALAERINALRIDGALHYP